MHKFIELMCSSNEYISNKLAKYVYECTVYCIECIIVLNIVLNLLLYALCIVLTRGTWAFCLLK